MESARKKREAGKGIGNKREERLLFMIMDRGARKDFLTEVTSEQKLK